MAKIDTYNAITGTALADDDLLVAWDISSSGEKFKNITVAEFGNAFAKLDEATVNFTGAVTVTSITGTSGLFSGDVNAGTFTGDGSALTGIASGTGGVINTGSTTIGADSDANGSGVIALQTRGVTRVTIENLGDVLITGGTTPTLSIGVQSGNVATVLQLEGSNTKKNWQVSTHAITNDALEFIPSTVAGGTTYSTAVMTLLDTGKVGIGTSAPVTLLTLAGTGIGASGAKIRFLESDETLRASIGVSGGTSDLVTGDADNDLVIRKEANTSMHFATGADIGMTLDASNNVGIGTATFGTSATTSLAIGNGIAPTTSVANQIEIFSVDILAVATLGLRTEAAVTVDVDETKFSDKLPVKINGTDYFIMLTQT